MTTLVCAPLMVEDVEEALAWARLARDMGADLVEYRVDDLFAGEGDDEGARAVERLVRASPAPCIVTCRGVEEGGGYDGGDDARIALYEALGTGTHPPAYLDLELSTFERSANLRQKVRLCVEHSGQAKDLSTRLIVSTHDFDGRPTDLTRRLGAMLTEDAARVAKIAFRARSLRDNLELFELLSQREKPTIALGMGRFGLMSRVLAPKFGGFLTFASLREEETTAPGQPTITDLLHRYRFRSIGPSTRVYGVVGWPAEHSIGPDVHNAAFDVMGHDGVYLPLPVAPEWESFKATLLALIEDPRLGFAGASVTMPHKEHALRLAHHEGWSIDAASRACGVANTIVVEDDGSVRVLNTDVAGVRTPLERTLGSLEGMRVLVLGTGGAARGAAHACRAAEVVIAGRDDEKARQLADRAGAEACAIESLADQRFDALVHCTPVGMSAGDDPQGIALPVETLEAWGASGDGPVVFDTVYTPRVTPLLERASSLGMRTIEGVAMFVEQGAAQSSAWTGLEPARGVMQRVAEESLDSRG